MNGKVKLQMLYFLPYRFRKNIPHWMLAEYGIAMRVAF